MNFEVSYYADKASAGVNESAINENSGNDFNR